MSLLHTRRARGILAGVAMVAAAAPIAALGIPRPAVAVSALDVYAVQGGASAVRITVQTGYSFVVEPDAMLPRATASILADRVTAVASPLDPGDSVDALPGLGVPTAEQDIQQGVQSPAPNSIPAPSPLNLAIPSPIAGSTMPPQLSQPIVSGVSTVASVVNPTLTAPYAHAVATYPQPGSNGPQQATFPPGSSDNVPPDFPDLLGLISAHSSSGSASASEGSGIADAGVGSAVSIPALGLRIGRTSSHVEVSGATGPAISRVVTTLHDVDVQVPSLPGGLALPVPAGTTLLHIGSLVLTVTTQRAPGAATATSHTDLEATGVSVLGQAARLDQNGLTVLGSPSPLNQPAQQLVGMLSSPRCAPNPPIGIPNGPELPASQPVFSIGPPVLHDQLSHGGNERTVSMSGLTLCMATVAPVPNASSNPVSPTPTVYTITLGQASSSAYGISLPADTGTGGTLLPPLPETGVLPGTGGTDTSTTTTEPGAPGANAASSGGTGAGSGGGFLARLTGGILSPQVVVAMASLAELAVLLTLWASYRMAAGRRREESRNQPMDLV
jgi:hypothetical protein